MTGDLAPGQGSTAVVPLASAEDLTPSWLQSALRAAGFDVTITGLSVEPVGTGQLSVSLRARFAVESPASGLPSSVVVKIPSADATVRERLGRGYQVEVGFYRELARTVKVDVPRCHLAVASEDGTSFALVLEDLAPATQGDQVTGASVAQVTAAARNLAGLHGPRWNDPALRGHPALILADPATDQGLAGMYAMVLPMIASRLGPALSPEDLATLTEAGAVMGDFLKARPHRFAMIHGDYRLDNLLFSPDGRVSAVDWQTVTIGLPARDLAYLVGTALSVADRRAAEAGLVEAYWTGLREHGVTGFSQAECFEDYRLGMLQGPFIAVLGMAFGTPTERGDAMFAAMIARSCQAIRDLGTIQLATAGE
jgi:hypothetical protein